MIKKCDNSLKNATEEKCSPNNEINDWLLTKTVYFFEFNYLINDIGSGSSEDL